MKKLIVAAVAITALLASCGGTAPSPEVPAKDRPGVVVFEFSTKSPDLGASLGGDVSQSLIEALLKGGRMKPVERQELARLLEEQEFSQSGMVRDEDALKIGKIAGARYILLGTLSSVAGQIRINARLLDVETSEIILADSVYGPQKDIFKLEESLARKIEAGAR